jgi:uncharacterized protein YndB with AHSA1/START domain
MLRHEFAVVIRRPVEEVFAYVTDLPRTGEWRTTVLEADALEGSGSSAVGARFRAVTRVAARRWDWILEVTRWDPPSGFAYSVVEGSVPMEVEYRLEQHEEGCRFTLEAATEPIRGIFGRLVVPVIAWGMQREVRMHVRNLQRILEVPQA